MDIWADSEKEDECQNVDKKKVVKLLPCFNCNQPNSTGMQYCSQCWKVRYTFCHVKINLVQQLFSPRSEIFFSCRIVKMCFLNDTSQRRGIKGKLKWKIEHQLSARTVLSLLWSKNLCHQRPASISKVVHLACATFA